MRVCVRCGEPEQYKEHFCKSCYLVLHPPELQSKEILVQICRFCDRFFFQNRWQKFASLDLAIRNVVRASIKKPSAQVSAILPQFERKSAKKVRFEVRVVMDGVKFHLPARFSFARCEVCERELTGYYEAVIQLRNVSEEAVSFVRSAVESKNEVYVTKEEKVHNGFDFYITDGSLAKVLGKRLQDGFGGIYKLSRKLHTQEKTTSKRVYKLTVLFKQFPFKKGDIFSYRGDDYKVLSVSKDVFAQDLVSKKKVHLTFAELERYKVV